jgi:hypothetical protein
LNSGQGPLAAGICGMSVGTVITEVGTSVADTETVEAGVSVTPELKRQAHNTPRVSRNRIRVLPVILSSMNRINHSHYTPVISR